MCSAASARDPEGGVPVQGMAGGTQAVDRAITLLKAVAISTTQPTVQELAHACRINRSTAWRLLRTLEHHGMVDRDVVTQRYSIGYGAIAIATAADDAAALVRRARPLLEELASRTGEAVNLAVAKDLHVVPVQQVDPPGGTMPSWQGRALPLHATSGGKVLLAWLTPREREAMLPAELPRYTAQTITDRSQLEQDLDAVRRSGYAVSVREYEDFTSGASAPVLGTRGAPVAVLTIWGPAPRNPVRRLRQLGKDVAKTAQQVRELLS